MPGSRPVCSCGAPSADSCFYGTRCESKIQCNSPSGEPAKSCSPFVPTGRGSVAAGDVCHAAAVSPNLCGALPRKDLGNVNGNATAKTPITTPTLANGKQRGSTGSPAATGEDDGDSAASVIVPVVVILLLVICAVVVAVTMKRQREAKEAQEKKEAAETKPLSLQFSQANAAFDAPATEPVYEDGNLTPNQQHLEPKLGKSTSIVNYVNPELQAASEGNYDTLSQGEPDTAVPGIVGTGNTGAAGNAARLGVENALYVGQEGPKATVGDADYAEATSVTSAVTSIDLYDTADQMLPRQGVENALYVGQEGPKVTVGDADYAEATAVTSNDLYDTADQLLPRASEPEIMMQHTYDVARTTSYHDATGTPTVPGTQPIPVTSAGEKGFMAAQFSSRPSQRVNVVSKVDTLKSLGSLSSNSTAATYDTADASGSTSETTYDTAAPTATLEPVTVQDAVAE